MTGSNFRLLLFLLFLFIAAVFEPAAQNSPVPFTIRIDSIAITGNDITDNDIILAELGFKPGSVVDSLILEFNRKRVYSLQLFTSVDFNLSKLDTLNLLTIAVKESWYIYPIPFIDRNEKDWTKLSYGLNLKIFNFRGRNEQLSGNVKFGYDPGYSLFYNIPYFFRDEQISLQTNISYTRRKNRSDVAELLYGESFKQDVLNASVTLGKRFSLFHRVSVTGGYNYIETPKYLPGVNATSDRIDRYGYAGIRYSYDTRNLNIAPTAGTFMSTGFTYKGIGNSEVSYGIAEFDLRKYYRIIGPVHLKWRFGLKETTGSNIPFYDIAILGSDDRVRGHYDTRNEGRGFITGTVETYFNVINELPIEFRLPIVPRSLTRYRVSLGFQFFYDAGISRPEGGSYFSNGVYQRGYGFGVTVAVLPYNIARAELAFDENGNSQIILDLGLSF